MSQDEIIKYLSVIDYRKDDSSVRGAIGRLLESKKYGPAYRGVISDPKIREELIEIIDAFKKLKDLKQEEINEAIKCMFNDNIVEEEKVQEFTENGIYEFIKYFDNQSYHILKKNIQTGNYEETISCDIENGDYVTNNYVVKKDDGIYDYFGKKVYPYQKIAFIGGDYYQNKENKNIYYNLINGEELDITKIGNAKMIIDLMRYNGNLKAELLSYLFQKRNLSYLNYKIEEITGRYLYCTNGNEICYFDLSGEKIISTENSIYSFIGKPTKKDSFSSYEYQPSKENNIIIVGQYDNNFNQKYGYYDLENRKEILKPRYNYLTNWIDMCGIGDNKDVITKNKIIKCDLDEIIGWRESYKIKNIIDVGNNNYLIDTGDGIVLVYDLLNKPKKKDFIRGYIYKHIDDKYIINYYGDESYYDNGKFKKLTISSLLDIYSSKYITNYKNNNKENNLLLKNNSAFLLDRDKTSLFLDGESSKHYLVKKDEMNYPLERQNIQDNINIINSIFCNNEISLHVNDCEKRVLPDKWGTNFVEFKLADNGHYSMPDNNKKYLILSGNNKILNGSNLDLLWEDYDGNVAIRIKWGNGKKEFVLGKDGNILLGPVDDVFYPRQNMSIVTNQTKMMLYMNYIPLSCQADKYEFVSKHYILKKKNEYEEVDYKEIILVQNEEDLYVIDDDGDKAIRMSQRTKNLMSLLSDNDLLSLNEEKQKTRRLIYEQK